MGELAGESRVEGVRWAREAMFRPVPTDLGPRRLSQRRLTLGRSLRPSAMARLPSLVVTPRSARGGFRTDWRRTPLFSDAGQQSAPGHDTRAPGMSLPQLIDRVEAIPRMARLIRFLPPDSACAHNPGSVDPPKITLVSLAACQNPWLHGGRGEQSARSLCGRNGGAVRPPTWDDLLVVRNVPEPPEVRSAQSEQSSTVA